MTILSLDTSAKSGSCAVVRDGEILCEFFLNNGHTHCETLLVMLHSVLSALGLTVSDIDAYAVGAGPGSFTGIRIGIATVKGLALSQDKPCSALSVTEAIARSVCAREDEIICACMDARRGQFYNAFFDSSHARLCPDRAIKAEELADEINRSGKRAVLCGDGAVLCQGLIKEKCDCIIGSESERFTHAASLGLLAEQKLEFISSTELLPTYLRPSQAEREHKKKERGL